MICRICEEDKDASKFEKDRRVCRACRNLQRIESYKENPEAKQKRLEQGRIIDALRKDNRLVEQRSKRFERKTEAIKYLGGQCFDCGLIGAPHCVYDFHHIRPEEKEMQVAVLMICSIERLYKELDKCILLCSNCHRIRHFDTPKE